MHAPLPRDLSPLAAAAAALSFAPAAAAAAEGPQQRGPRGAPQDVDTGENSRMEMSEAHEQQNP